MIIQGDHVAVQGSSRMMPWIIVQADHVAVQGFSWMMPWMIFQGAMLPYKDFHGRCHG